MIIRRSMVLIPHEDCVNLIRRAGDTLALKVVTANMYQVNA
jgi:hypothetical protein